MRAFDTTPEARAVQLKAIREMSLSQRVNIAVELSEAMMQLSRNGVRHIGTGR